MLLFCSYNIIAQQIQKIDSTNNGTVLQEVRISSMHINDSLMNTPAAIGILSEKNLQNNNHSDISTEMNTLAGVFMQTSNLTTNRISIRGIGARTPYGTNKIRAFYGSIPLTSGDSETTIEDIDIENISQIEVVKGPLSSVYGAGLGGAIVISPKTSEKIGNQATISTTYGSFNIIKNSINYSGATKSSSINLNYHKLQTDGWRDNSAYNREGITLSGELLRKKNSKMTYFSNYTWLKAFIPSSIDKKTFDENPKAAATTWAAAKGYKQYESVLGGLAYDWKISDHIENSTSVFVNYKDNYEPRPFDILAQYTFASGARTQFSGHFKIGKVQSRFIAGAEYFNDRYSGRTLQNGYKINNDLGSLEGDLLTANNQTRKFYNAFAQLRLEFSPQFELQTGLNVNQTSFKLEAVHPETNQQQYKYNPIWAPQVSVLYKPDRLKTIYISISRGFSLPIVEETLTATGAINPEIKPESGYNYEIGGKFYFLNKSLYTEIAAYRMEITDLLVAERIGDDQYVGVNAGKTLHEGIELSANYSWILKYLTLKPYIAASIGNYKFVEFNDRGGDFSGNKLTGVPANKVNLGARLETRFGWYLSSDYLFVDQVPLNDDNTVYSDAYKILNFKSGYIFTIFNQLNAEVSGGINNILNEKYASLILPNATGFGNAQPRFYYPGLPVNYYGNIAIRYAF